MQWNGRFVEYKEKQISSGHKVLAKKGRNLGSTIFIPYDKKRP